MGRFDRNNTSLIKKVVREEAAQPQIGIVEQVYEHAASDDDSNFEVDVTIDGSGQRLGDQEKLHRCPVHTGASGEINVPKKGDKILVHHRKGESKNPIVLGYGWSNKDRPPLGQAGMWRQRIESGQSDAGDGDLHITGYTEYDEKVASNDKRDVSPDHSLVQISKHAEGDNVIPTENPSVPAKIEFYDSAKTGDSWITVEIGKDGGSDSNAQWGMKFNISNGDWKIVGPNGFGITADGDGNFTWEHKDITFNEVSGSTGSLSL